MLRLSLALALITSPIALTAVETVRTVPFLVSKSSTGQSHSSLRSLIEDGNWSEVGHLVKKKAERHEISLKDLQMVALSFQNTPFFNAVLATKKILSMQEKTGLSLSVAFPIALFAETSLNHEVEKGKTFWNSSRFGRELQYDRSNKHLFIHLGTHGVKPVGIGRMKVVTKTILYDRENPEVMAHGVSEAGCKREMYAMKKLKGVPNTLQAQALMTHKDPKSGKRIASIITRIIHPGSLQSILDKKSWKLTLREKVQMARDIMLGIQGMQQKKFVHRDLGAKNYFVHIGKGKPGHRNIKAYVADFGRALPIKMCKDVPVQGNSCYAPPEAIYREKMRGNQYYNSDLFAIGCVFWQLYFGDLPPWSRSEYFKNESIPKKHRFRAKVFHINAMRERYAPKAPHGKVKKDQKPCLREGFLKIIMQMTDPEPSKRSDAESIYKALHSLLIDKKHPETLENKKDSPSPEDSKGHAQSSHKRGEASKKEDGKKKK